jgi:hypothetical protein
MKPLIAEDNIPFHGLLRQILAPDYSFCFLTVPTYN